MGGRSIREDLEALRIDRSASEARSARGWLWLGAVAIVVALAAAVAWWQLAGRAATVRTVTVSERGGSTGGAATVLNATGYVTARRRATVSSKITGKLVEVLVEEGMPVREGQVLARLDSTQARAVVDWANSRLGAARSVLAETRVQLELAELTLQRTQRLVADGIAGQADLDRARTEAQALRARLEQEQDQGRVAERELALRRTELEDTIVRAPFDGVVISKDAQPGEMVSPLSAGAGFTRTGICTIVDMRSLEIEVEVNESYISRVTPDQRAEAVLDAYPDWRIPARVITTIPAADRQKATVMVRVAFEQLDPRILPDMGVKVAFHESGDAAAATPRARLYVPRPALRKDGGRDVVFVVRDGEAERRAVTLGVTAGDDVEVIAGLTAGEQVIIEGPADLAQDDRVTIRD